MSKKGFLDSIEVKTPCAQSWNEMRGSEQIRFCDHCARDVHNLSEMTRKRARKIVRESGGGICVRYVRRPDGRIQTVKNTLHQITRQTGIAAGILSASLGVSTAAYAQTTAENSNKSEPEVTRIYQIGYFDPLEKDKTPGKISGTISDPSGAVIPFAFVTISDEQTNFYRSANTSQEGFYEFTDVPRGTFKLKVEASGFESKEIAQVSVGENAEETQDAQLAIQIVQTEVVVGGDETESRSVATMGIMVSSVSETKNKLILAVRDDNVAEVKMLIAKGKRVNVKDRNYDGNSPLHLAIENGNLEIAEVLLNAGAKIDLKNSQKRTPLMMLDEDATPELVNLLLRHGAKIDSVDKKKNTALILAAAYANEDVVQALISAGAGVNAVNKQGETALMNAAENSETEIVRLLLASGADANARNRDGKTALGLVKTDEAGQYLIAYGASR